MDQGSKARFKRILPPAILTCHLLLHIVLGVAGWIVPFEFFNLLLLLGNIFLCVWIVRGTVPVLEGVGVMLLIASHAFIGQRMAPDLLTSGTILLVNILILYVGFRIFSELSLAHCVTFVASYFLLFFIFVVWMSNAEALFLLSLLGLGATARKLKLVAYFWALVLSFTVCQPYAWEAAISSFFILKVVFSAAENKPSTTAVIFLGSGLVLLFLVLLPVAVLMLGESPHSILNIIRDERIRSAIYMTAVTATVSTIILAAFCIPLAYAISRLEFSGKTVLLSLIDVPIVIPQSVAGLALLRVFSKQQFLGEALFSAFGIQFDGTMLGICLAQIFVAMPFIMKSSIAAFDSVPRGLETVARTLGASSFGSFRRVAVPLAARGLFLSAVLAWARAAGEFGALLFIAPYPETAPVAAYNRFTSVGIIETAPLVSLLLLFSLAMFFLLQLAARTMRTMHQTGEI
ncbi:MAG: ABC transporter permease subunit [Planctomycetota bacterium]|nr:MAG: ABC transporter permease subunit [Planctomycetota bacterium]